VVAAFAVFGFVVDDGYALAPGSLRHSQGRFFPAGRGEQFFNLHLADGVVALEVGGVVVGVPQTKLDGREQAQVGAGATLVGESHFPDFEIVIERDKSSGADIYPPVLGFDDRVAHAMPTGIPVQTAADGHPTGRPELAAGVVAQVEVASAHVERGVVVAVAGQAAQAGVFIERVSASGVGY